MVRITPDLLFAEASTLWLSSRRLSSAAGGPVKGRFIKEETEKSYHAYIESLNLFFESMRLDQINLSHVRDYQDARVAGAAPFIRYRRPQDALERKVRGVVIPAKGKTPCPANPKKVNQEISILRMVMVRAGCWPQEFDDLYERLEEEFAEIPRALSVQEQKHWLDAALTHQRWWLVYWYSVLAFETSMSTNEMRALRIGDINLSQGIVSVPPAGAKNQYRVRTIPLITPEAKWAAEQLLARARDLGAVAPQHYLFPFRNKRDPFDPTRPMTVSGVKKIWEEVRKASGLTWFRPYDTRHTAITRWAEGGMAPATIMAMAGHVSEQMMRHYTHISDMAKRRALEATIARTKPRGERPVAQGPFYVPRSNNVDLDPEALGPVAQPEPQPGERVIRPVQVSPVPAAQSMPAKPAAGGFFASSTSSFFLNSFTIGR